MLQHIYLFILITLLSFVSDTSAQNLKGIKIAIDPGHSAGTLAEALIEKKYVIFKLDSTNVANGLTDSVEIFEPNSTLATAFILKQKLEAKGAQVLLSRSKQGYSSFDKTFAQWYAEKYLTAHEVPLKKNAKKTKIPTERYAFVNGFNVQDIAQRAKIINAYKPDATIIIHYNADEKNEPWSSPTQKNFNMIFVPTLTEYADSVGQQFMNYASVASKNLLLAQTTIQAFEKVLKVPAAKVEDATYLKDKCETTPVTGVYVRQLALNKMVKGVVIYGETLYQDNINESKLLNKKTLTINGIAYSERVAQVAEAYYQGIINYYKTLQHVN
jgi:N-acetylmuramoyl-L-alanine amidase